MIKQKYRLLTKDDIIQETDELIMDDTVTWIAMKDNNRVTRLLIGQQYHYRLQPMRRPLQSKETKEQEHDENYYKKLASDYATDLSWIDFMLEDDSEVNKAIKGQIKLRRDYKPFNDLLTERALILLNIIDNWGLNDRTCLNWSQEDFDKLAFILEGQFGLEMDKALELIQMFIVIKYYGFYFPMVEPAKVTSFDKIRCIKADEIKEKDVENSKEIIEKLNLNVRLLF